MYEIFTLRIHCEKRADDLTVQRLHFERTLQIHSMEEAFLWWNRGNGGSEDASPPTLPSVKDASLCWIEMAPIFHTFLDENDQNYWKSVVEITKKFAESDDVPDPESDFPGFICVLYKIKDFIKPQNYENCKKFVNLFYTQHDSVFFLKEFLYGVSDPFLSVTILHQMFKEKFPPFIDFLMQYGAIERFFDMFVTFLCPLSGNIEDDFFEFRIVLADLLTEILTSNIRPIILVDDVISNFYSRLLNLINYSKKEASLCFARDAIHINNTWLKTLTAEQASTRITTMITSAPVGKAAHNYICRYALSQAGKYISHSRLVSLLTKQGFKSNYDLEFLRSIADAEGSDAVKVVIHTFAKLLCSSKVFMRASGQLLIDELIKNGEDKEVHDWTLKFITLLIIFIKKAILGQRFVRRANLLCEIITSEPFRQVKWLYKGVQSNANAAYLIDNKPEIFKLYFHVGKQYPAASYFEREYKKYSQFLKKTKNLKSFPFKVGTNQLIKISDIESSNPFDKGNDAVIDESLKDLGLGPRALRYVYHDFDAGTIEQQQSIFLLEDFIDHEKERFEKTEYFHDRFVRIDVSCFMPNGRMELSAIKHFCQDMEDQIWNYQTNALNEFISIAKEIIAALEQHPHLIANIKALTRDLNLGCSDDQRYKKLKAQRKRLKKLAERKAAQYRVPNYLVDLHDILFSMFYKFDANMQYSPPSDIDDHIINFINFSEFKIMIDATTDIVISGSVDAAIQTIWELNTAIVEKTQLRGEATLIIIYTSIVRYMFDINYIKNPELNLYKEANKSFVELCKQFAEQPIGILSLSDEFLSKVSARGTISNFFKNRNHTLNIIDFFTNPIDIMTNIHISVQTLNTIVPGLEIKASDRLRLVLGLIVTFPPQNTIAIIKFVDKWSTVTPSNNIMMSYMLFKKAVNSIFPIHHVPTEKC